MTMETTTETVMVNPEQIVELLQAQPGQWVADFGVGGNAAVAIPLAQRTGPDGGVVMFDILKSALSAAMSMAAARNVTNCKAVWTNLETYGGAKGVQYASLDGGVAVNLLHQSKHYKDMLAEMHRMLKAGARLVIIDWKPEADSPIAPARDRRLSADRVLQVAQELSFAPLSTVDISSTHWGLVVVRT